MTSPVPSPARGFYFEELDEGMSDSTARTISEADIVLFAGVTGDTNPVHLNQVYAETTRFGGRIAHGMLSAGLISTVIGTRLPGPGSIYVAQNLSFKAPVRIGDTVTAVVTVTEKITKRRFVKLETNCWVGDQLVISGDATVMVPSDPNIESA